MEASFLRSPQNKKTCYAGRGRFAEGEGLPAVSPVGGRFKPAAQLAMLAFSFRRALSEASFLRASAQQKTCCAGRGRFAEGEGLPAVCPVGGRFKPAASLAILAFSFRRALSEASFLRAHQNKKNLLRRARQVCGGGGIRTPGTRKRTLVFKTSAFNQLCHPSK